MALEYEIKANGVGFDALERELKGFAGTADEFAKKLRSLGVELAKGGQGDYVESQLAAQAHNCSSRCVESQLGAPIAVVIQNRFCSDICDSALSLVMCIIQPTSSQF